MRAYGMSKITVVKGLQADKIMANMSASILRNLVASVFNIKATSVKLSGVLPETFCVSEDNSSGSLYSCNSNVSVHAFSPTEGFVEVQGTNDYSSQNANGSWNNEYGVSFKDCSQHETAIFFVVREQSSGWQEGREDWDNNITTIYKAPDFKSHWAKIEAQDIARWEAWLAE